jgi:hypothetical protein
LEDMVCKTMLSYRNNKADAKSLLVSTRRASVATASTRKMTARPKE